MILSLIAAMTSKRVIGYRNHLPWRIPEDLQYFKSMTSGKPVVMGRKTFESLGKPLPGRENWVITSDERFPLPAGVVRASSLEEAIRAFSTRNVEVFIIGGAGIYAESLKYADRIYLTLVEREYEGDVYFPEIPTNDFVEASRTPGKSSDPPIVFIRYDRKSPKKPLP